MPTLRRDWVLATVLAVTTFAIFVPALGYEFINFDDPEYVTCNPQVTRGLRADGVWWALTAIDVFYWHPLTWLSLQLDATLSWPSPKGFHLTNVLLHAANAAVLFLALRSLTGTPWRSFVVAALFAVHPLRVESVAWVAERKDVLSVFFGFLAILAYARYARAPTWPRYLAVALFLALSLMSKPMLVTLPFVLLILDWWPLQRWQACGVRRIVAEKLPLIALAAGCCVVAVVGQRRFEAVGSVDVFPPLLRLENAVVSYAAYLEMALWPARLAIFYPHPVYVYDGEGGLSLVQVAGSALLLVALTILALVLRKRAPYLLAGWLWYLISSVVVIGLIQAGAQARADRFTYFPQVGIAVAVCWGAADLLRSRKTFAAVVSVAILAMLVVRTETQLPTWHDSLTVWEHALGSTRKTPIGLLHLGDALARKGHEDEAYEAYRDAICLDPYSARAHNSLGNLLSRRGKTDAAVRELTLACDLAPNLAEARTNLGNVLFSQKRLDEAAAKHREAIQLNPLLVDAYGNLAQVEMARQRPEVAADCYREMLRLRPHDPVALTGLGAALIVRGKPDEAFGCAREALQYSPRFARAYLLMALVMEQRQRPADAAEYFREALRLDPALRPQVEGRLQRAAAVSEDTGGHEP
jgi:tetratricopeptide (TPR) repeat protein